MRIHILYIDICIPGYHYLDIHDSVRRADTLCPESIRLSHQIDLVLDLNHVSSLVSYQNPVFCCIGQYPYESYSETSKSIRGAFFSPFMRAYSPVLAEAGISIEDFLSFIDKLNEVFIASPGLQMTGLIGGVMTMVPLHPVQLAGVGVQLASGVGSATISYTRTRLYLQTANEELFNSHGLHCTIMSTKKMTAKLGFGQEEFQQYWSQASEPELNVNKNEDISTSAHEADTRYAETFTLDIRMYRLMALRGYAAPLQTEGLPERVVASSMVQRLNGKFAARQEARQMKKMGKDRHEGNKRKIKKLEEAEKEWQQEQKKVEKIEFQMSNLQVKRTKKLQKNIYDSKKSEEFEKEFKKETSKLQKDLDKAIHERDKKARDKTEEGHKEWDKVIRKERSTAQKVRWIVISCKDEQLPSDEIELN